MLYRMKELQFKGNIATFLKNIKLNESFLTLVSDHPWINGTKNTIEETLDEPKFFSSMIIFLNATGIKTPRYALKTLGVSKKADRISVWE